MAARDLAALPLYLAYRTDVGTGSVSLVVARRNQDGTICYGSFLIDLWKVGLKDSYGSFSIKRKKFDDLVNRLIDKLERNEGGYYHPIEEEDTKWLVAQGVRIANSVGTPASRHWVRVVVDDVSDVPISGSLYKCYSCERGELSKDEDALILSTAIEERRSGDAGTPAESMLYFVCDRCGSRARAESEKLPGSQDW